MGPNIRTAPIKTTSHCETINYVAFTRSYIIHCRFCLLFNLKLQLEKSSEAIKFLYLLVSQSHMLSQLTDRSKAIRTQAQ